MKKVISDILLVLIGNAILAFGYAVFAIPADLIVGGATGIALTLEKLINIDYTNIVFVINMIMLIFGLIFLGKNFVAGTILSSFAFPIFLEVFENIKQLQNVSNDVLLCTIYAGVCIGIGLGIVFRRGYSTGGMDVPPLIINQKTGISLAFIINVCDIIILFMQIFFSSFEGILYGIIAVVISNFVLDKVLIIGERNIQVLVISSKHEEIAAALFKEVNRGCTFMNITTGYLQQSQKAVMSVVSARQYPKVNDLVLDIDPTAFIISNDIHSVKGRGFTLPDIDL
ncbi:MAG: YitT family protein [Erysipelotrichaceae bacterium]|nr:YitT family protein [Erysipelotrichaceae bacterium]